MAIVGYVCGVSTDNCTGAKIIQASNGIKAGSIQKSHGSSSDAFRCMRRDLLRRGYTQVGPREFSPPDGGPIRVLTKKSRFGAALRSGKEGRAMPRKHTGGDCWAV